MSKDRKLVILTSIAAIAIVTYLVSFYERKLSVYKDLLQTERSQALKFNFSDDEIRSLIKNLPAYQGDSLTIDKQGRLISSDGLIQSVIEQMYIVPANLEGIREEAKAKRQPEQFLVYKTAIGYFIDQYGDRNLKKPDNLTTGDSLNVK